MGTLRIATENRISQEGVGALADLVRSNPDDNSNELQGDMAQAGGTAEFNIAQPTIILAYYIRVL